MTSRWPVVILILILACRHRALGAVITAAVMVGCSGGPAVSPTPVTSSSPPPVASPSPTQAAPSATLSPLPEPSISPQPSPTATPGARVYTFDDGALTIEVPPGAVPDGTQLTATQLGPEDRPPELADVEIRGSFYRLEPDGLTFAQPVLVTRRLAVADTGFDLATDGLPIITLALRTSEGNWSWLENQSIVSDGEHIYISGEATHTSVVMGLGGPNFVRYSWEPPDLVVPVGDTFALDGMVTAPLNAPAPPLVRASAADIVERYLDRYTGREPFTHTGVLGDYVAGSSEIANTPDWDNLPIDERGNAMPRFYQEFECARPAQFVPAVGYEVVGLGAGTSLYERLELGPPGTTLLFGADVTCMEVSRAEMVTPTSGCLIVVHTARGTFISYLRALLGFGDAGADVRRIEVTIEGANDDEPVLAEPLADNLYEALLGLRGAGPVELKQVLVTGSDGMQHDGTSIVAVLLGGSTFDVPFPGEPTFGTCPPGTP